MDNFTLQGLQPGIYFGLDDKFYHADEGVSRSIVKDMLTNPAIMFENHRLLNPHWADDGDTASRKVGRATHTRILEPKKFNYKLDAAHKTSSKDGILGQEQWDTVQGCANAIFSLPETIGEDFTPHGLLSNGYPEVTFVWIDPETGLKCRVRVDYLRWRFFTDYKTHDDGWNAVKIDDYTVCQTINKNHYELQSGMYSEGIEFVKRKINEGDPAYGVYGEVAPEWLKGFLEYPEAHFAIVFAEKNPPYLVRGDIFTPPLVEAGKAFYRKGLDLFKAWLDSYEPGQRVNTGYERVKHLHIEDMETLAPSFKYKFVG